MSRRGIISGFLCVVVVVLDQRVSVIGQPGTHLDRGRRLLRPDDLFDRGYSRVSGLRVAHSGGCRLRLSGMPLSEGSGIA
jgi:hypothetical protein